MSDSGWGYPWTGEEIQEQEDLARRLGVLRIFGRLMNACRKIAPHHALNLALMVKLEKITFEQAAIGSHGSDAASDEEQESLIEELREWNRARSRAAGVKV